MNRRPSWITRRNWYSPRFQWHLWSARRRDARLIQQPCPEGNCTDLVDPKTGHLEGGWGPVDCPCDDTRRTA